MADYKQLGNYILFEEKNPDSIGKNFRVGELENRKVKNHHIMSEVHPMLYTNPKVWKRITLLLEGIKKSNISGLYSPDKMLSLGEKQMLIFPYLNYKTFDSVLEDSVSQGIPINFDLAFSIAIAIADLLDIGSSIVISGKKSSHGFLTPDNILIDFEGKIYLKNYGIYPYLDKDETIFSGMEKQYGSWLTPELFRREDIVSQSDVYHLGYLMFKMLTGQYFSYSEGEDFDSKLENISFSQHIHESNKDFISGLQEFFRKTLHPEPGKRFANSKEFKEFVSKTFSIEELSSVTFNLAYFMDSLYGKERTNLQAKIEQEKLFVPPVKTHMESPSGKVDTELVETILSGLEQRSPKPKLFMIIASVVIAVIAVGSYFFVQSNKAKQEKLRKQEQIQLRKEQDKRVSALQEQLRAIEDKATQSEEEKVKQEAARQQLLLELEKEKKEKDRLKLIEEGVQKQEEERKKKQEEEAEKKKQEEEARLKKAADEKKKQDEIDRKKREEEALKPKRGELLPISELDKKPLKISGKSITFPPSIRGKYAGNKFEARIMCLIDENGTVLSVRILNSIPKDIKRSIEKNIIKWKYSPAEKKGVQVRVWFQLKLAITI